MQGVWVRSLVGELRSLMSWDQKTKKYKGKNIVTNSEKTLKMVHIETLKKKKNAAAV